MVLCFLRVTIMTLLGDEAIIEEETKIILVAIKQYDT
jgi:hypothetical protein